MVFDSIDTHGWRVDPDLRKHLPETQHMFLEEYQDRLAGVLITAQQIDNVLERCAEKIVADYCAEGIDTITATCVLKGATTVFDDLIKILFKKGLRTREDVTYWSRYGSGLKGGTARVSLDFSETQKGDHCLVVEDITDQGITLNDLASRLRLIEPASVKLFALILKDKVYKGELHVQYPAFLAEDHWFVGRGMDLNVQGRAVYRDLPFVAVANPDYLLRTKQINEDKAAYLKSLINI